MNIRISDNQKKSLVGSGYIYCTFFLICLIIIRLLQIGTGLGGHDQYEIIVDIINYVISFLTSTGLIIAPVIGASLIITKTKQLAIGKKSIKYFFIPFFVLNILLLLDTAINYFFNPAMGVMGRFLQFFGFGLILFLFIFLVLYRFVSLILVSFIFRNLAYEKV